MAEGGMSELKDMTIKKKNYQNETEGKGIIKKNRTPWAVAEDMCAGTFTRRDAVQERQKYLKK